MGPLISLINGGLESKFLYFIMSFYPLFNINENKGFVTLANFSPNNWEKVYEILLYALSYRTNGEKWQIDNLGTMVENELRVFEAPNFASLHAEEHNGTRIEELVLLEFRLNMLANQVDELPASILPATHWPESRATIGFKSENSRVSYQGEINPTPPKSSLLTFHPFIQFDDIHNYFIFVNIEKAPQHRWSEMEIFHSQTGKKIDSKKIRNNAANIIKLDEYGFTPDNLPVFYCKSMAGIPFGFGQSISTGMLSLEHTHPPASLTLHGNRLFSQRDIKMAWVKHLKIT